MMVQVSRGWPPSVSDWWFRIAAGATVGWLLVVFFLSGEIGHRWFWVLSGVLLLVVVAAWIVYGVALRRNRRPR